MAVRQSLEFASMAKPFKDGVDQGRRVVPSGKTILSGDAGTTLLLF